MYPIAVIQLISQFYNIILSESDHYDKYKTDIKYYVLI